MSVDAVVLFGERGVFVFAQSTLVHDCICSKDASCWHPQTGVNPQFSRPVYTLGSIILERFGSEMRDGSTVKSILGVSYDVPERKNNARKIETQATLDPELLGTMAVSQVSSSVRCVSWAVHG